MSTQSDNALFGDTPSAPADPSKQSSTDVLGVYTKPNPQIRTRGGVINQRSFIPGGINKTMPPYLLDDTVWHDSWNMVFDHDRAKMLLPRSTVDQLIATPSTEQPSGSNRVLPAFPLPAVPRTGQPGLVTSRSYPGIPVFDHSRGPNPEPPFDPLDPYAVIALPPGPITLSPFDYVIFRYSWGINNGRDLDTRTGLINTGTPLDNEVVGWNDSYIDTYVINSTGLPTTGSSAQGPLSLIDELGNVLMIWGGDNTTDVGDEAVLVNMVNLTAFAQRHGLTSLQVRALVYWYGQIYTDGNPADSGLNGNFTLQLQTFIGGTMVPFVTGSLQIDWTNSGGVAVDDVIINLNDSTFAQTGSGPNGTPAGDLIGSVIYNIFTKTATVGS